ncbi:peptidase M16 [Actinomycetospora sp. NBRC 106375]|uniref:M16 family metallopeptidase n=1 Tax=Actinomycetospora sp. NBRC 106375 TaxID=3032207 RepID=UPI0024A16600|nr:pitrilysin family protein [Actinomycetospora sp. NBRC 106375]GLZ47603.1 peptidase M16 [Actinomycetospora sp. NBRC 106375]
MTSSVTAPGSTDSTAQGLHRRVLDNGLRVLLVPDTAAPVVGVAVHVDVGFRSEPEGRTGFAHLFEHLMFQGSESLEKLAHFRHVQSSGGVFNGSTHQDYTNYFEVLPSAALERALFLEADRLRAPRLTAENLRNQVDVVKEEIRLNVLNRPYGGFPWILLPPVLYDTYPNAHNGYGDFTDLEQADLDDAAGFFDAYYAPGNAVLTVVGDLDPDDAAALVEKHFGDIPARAVPERPSFGEPPPDRERRDTVTDANAPMPALAVGYRLPDPATDLPGYLAHAVLASLLTDGEAARLTQRLVYGDELVTDVSASCGLMGAPLDARDPDTFTLTAVHPASVEPDRILGAVDEELATLAAQGPDPEELRRVTARWASSLHREHDRLMSRMLALGSAELVQGRAELADELPGMLAAVEPAAVAAAAGSLRPDSRAVLTVTPGGAA